jgi:hypothetical protein
MLHGIHILLQDIKLSEVTQKMAELELRMAQELAPLWALKVQQSTHGGTYSFISSSSINTAHRCSMHASGEAHRTCPVHAAQMLVLVLVLRC